MKRYILLLLALISFEAFSASNVTTIEYELRKGKTPVADVKEVFTRSGKTYTITSDAAAKGVLALIKKNATINRKSQGEMTSKGLQPKEFSDQRGDSAPAVARFDWKNKTVTLQRDGAPETLPLTGVTHDHLSLPYNFAFHSAPVGELNLFIADGKHLNPVLYKVVGKESISTPLGKLDTIHLAKQREKEDSGTDIWLATAYNLLPARVLITDKDGDTLDQVVTKISR